MSPAGSASISLLCLFQLMASTEFQTEEFGDAYQRHPSLVMVCLLLRRLITLSERPAMVSRASSRVAMLAAGGWGSG